MTDKPVDIEAIKAADPEMGKWAAANEEWLAMRNRDEPMHPDLVAYMTEVGGGNFGVMLKHPLVYDMFPHPASVNYAYAQKRKILERAKREENWNQVIWIYERPYRLDALMGIADLVSNDVEFWDLAADVWVDSENIFQHIDDWITIFDSGRPDRDTMMSDEDRAALAAMDDPITVYRGFTLGVNEEGLSWTTSLERATWFAKRFNHKGDAEVVQGEVARDDVVAYFTRRGESEIVVGDLDVVQFVDYLLGADPYQESGSDEEETDEEN